MFKEFLERTGANSSAGGGGDCEDTYRIVTVPLLFWALDTQG